MDGLQNHHEYYSWASFLPRPWVLTAITDTGITVAVNVAAGDTISVVKAKIHEKSDIPTHQQRLIFDGEIFADDLTLADAGCPWFAFLDLRGPQRLEVEVYQDGDPPRAVVVTVCAGDNIRTVKAKISVVTGIAPWRMELREASDDRLRQQLITYGPRLYVVSRIRCECWS
jgi:hypothetical protein